MDVGHTFVLSVILNVKTGEPNAMRSKDANIIRWAVGIMPKGWRVGKERGI